MEQESKTLIYKGMIQYILGSTNYTLNHIAQFSHLSLDSIRAIYYHDLLQISLNAEIQLLKLYQIVLEINSNQKIA
ncbi:MAG: hypothetical protein EBZ58_12740 [Bacteroidetes bacterium]|nr:hypothetical protein [Bacteroidota bacterium]